MVNNIDMFSEYWAKLFILVAVRGKDRIYRAGYVKLSSSQQCESDAAPRLQEGNLGQSAACPWLGVLRVHIHNKDKFTIALTGIVLVKKKYALASADDLAKIPHHVLITDSKAMFIPEESAEPWLCAVRRYIPHPEYEYATLNTIALLELDPGGDLPMLPICWPKNEFNTSNELYAVSFVDDNQILEKSLYSIMYVQQTFCEEFYSRAGLKDDKLTPTHYQCGFAKNNKEDCVWDNGMVLVSNSTRHWTMVGFGVRGPGCAAPARFIDLLTYLPWVETATGPDELADYGDYEYGGRRSAHQGDLMKKETNVNDSIVLSSRYKYLGPGSATDTGTATANAKNTKRKASGDTKPEDTATTKSNNTRPESTVLIKTSSTKSQITTQTNLGNTRSELPNTSTAKDTKPADIDMIKSNNTKPQATVTIKENNSRLEHKVTIKVNSTRPESVTEAYRVDIDDESVLVNFSCRSSVRFVHVLVACISIGLLLVNC